MSAVDENWTVTKTDCLILLFLFMRVEAIYNSLKWSESSQSEVKRSQMADKLIFDVFDSVENFLP